MRQRLSGMILALAWANRPEDRSLWTPTLLDDLSPRERFQQVWSGTGSPTDRAWRGLLAAAFGAALHEEGQGHHVHFWLSERARAWLPEWMDGAADEERRQLLILRKRLQDVFSLGINLRRRDSLELVAALRDLEADIGFAAPEDCEPPEGLWEPSVVIAAASWAGRNLPRAFSVIDEMKLDGSWLLALAGLLFGRDALLAEFEALGADTWRSSWLALEQELKKSGRSVEDRVEELLS